MHFTLFPRVQYLQLSNNEFVVSGVERIEMLSKRQSFHKQLDFTLIGNSLQTNSASVDNSRFNVRHMETRLCVCLSVIVCLDSI